MQPKAEGQTLHGDHAFVSYQVPANPRAFPLVMLHGAGQFSRTWDTTPDGRDGYRNIFLEAGYPVYLVDQPRRGTAGRSTVAGKMVWGGLRGHPMLIASTVRSSEASVMLRTTSDPASSVIEARASDLRAFRAAALPGIVRRAPEGLKGCAIVGLDNATSGATMWFVSAKCA